MISVWFLPLCLVWAGCRFGPAESHPDEKNRAQITLQATRIVADLPLGVNQLRIRVSDNISKAIVAPSTTFAIRIEPPNWVRHARS